MWTRGLRTRSSLSWMLAMTHGSSFAKVKKSSCPARPGPDAPVPVAGSMLSFIAVHLAPRESRGANSGRPDADLLEQGGARLLVGDQFGQQFRQRHPAPAHRLFEGVRHRRVRLGAAEEVRDLQERLEGVLAVA